MAPKFVLAWITSSRYNYQKLENGGGVVFVKHPVRGWEIPGGHLKEGESPDQALYREIFEETGLKGKIVGWNKGYYPHGWVAHMICDIDFDDEPWYVDDKNVDEIKWWSKIPPVITWTEQEFVDLDYWCSQLYQS